MTEDFICCGLTSRSDCNFEMYTSLPLSHWGVEVVREEVRKEEGRIKVIYTPARRCNEWI